MGTETPELMTLETPSVGWTTFARVQDYARTWSSERGRCHRFVYDEHRKPDNCPEPNVTSGWCRDGQGRLYFVDACYPAKRPFQAQRRASAPTPAAQSPNSAVWAYIAALRGRCGLLLSPAGPGRSGVAGRRRQAGGTGHLVGQRHGPA
jgi:hypothetical protein